IMANASGKGCSPHIALQKAYFIGEARVASFVARVDKRGIRPIRGRWRRLLPAFCAAKTKCRKSAARLVPFRRSLEPVFSHDAHRDDA
ncbi:MAG TPA: hypothetical protein VEQ85_02680, partial [Lacipirellulaceae bacterium]|nr:hypothetical protein [Lacipirellulaceae bacterium]